MKLWWQNVVKDYFTFSQKERRGIIVISVVCIFIWLASRYFPVNKPRLEQTSFQNELAQLSITIDSSRSSSVYQQVDHVEYNRPRDYKDYYAPKGELFPFDPNTLDPSGWKKLGLRDKTVHTIQNFISKGYRFKKPEDLKKIWGLRAIEAERLIPYVRISEEAIAKPALENRRFSNTAEKHDEDRYKVKIIDINEADTSAFISLPGIGSKLAARIVNFREKLGGFSAVNQVAETYGIADSTFQKIKGRLQCIHPLVTKININTADANQLKTHPYIKWNIANAIVNYRKQHGDYKSIEELHKIEILSDEMIARLAPYIEL